MLSLVIGLCCLVSVAVGDAWMTNYDQPFNISCPTNTYIKQVHSIHDNFYNDRVFKINCDPLPGEAATGVCKWQGYANDFDGEFLYLCPRDWIISGVQSYHQNFQEDRRFQFQCCEIKSYITHACITTDYINAFDGSLNYLVPDDYVIKGIGSHHSNYYEDRQFKFEVCQLEISSVEVPTVGEGDN